MVFRKKRGQGRRISSFKDSPKPTEIPGTIKAKTKNEVVEEQFVGNIVNLEIKEENTAEDENDILIVYGGEDVSDSIQVVKDEATVVARSSPVTRQLQKVKKQTASKLKDDNLPEVLGSGRKRGIRPIPIFREKQEVVEVDSETDVPQILEEPVAEGVIRETDDLDKVDEIQLDPTEIQTINLTEKQAYDAQTITDAENLISYLLCQEPSKEGEICSTEPSDIDVSKITDSFDDASIKVQEHVFMGFDEDEEYDDEREETFQYMGLEDEDDQVLYECGSCRERFPSKNLLRKHFKIHFVGDDYVCEYCQEQFSDFTVFHDHVTQHVIEVYCIDCQTSFDSKEALEEHQIEHFLQCELCGARIPTEQEMLRHFDVDHNIVYFKCEVCDKYYRSKMTLRVHIESYHFQEKPICGICQRKFSDKRSLQRHLLIHADYKPHTCEVCNKSFRVKAYLNEHMLRHTKQYPHLCPVCNQGFSRKRYLENHMKGHFLNAKDEPENMVACQVCNKEFNSKTKLTIHMKVHSNERPYKCEICPKAFKFSSHLKVHVRLHTGDAPYKCDMAFAANHYLTYHLKRVHGNPNYRPRGEPWVPDRVAEFVPTPGKPHGCELCGKGFKYPCQLQVHFLKHKGEKPHKCKKCKKSFYTKARLKLHNKKSHDMKN